MRPVADQVYRTEMFRIDQEQDLKVVCPLDFRSLLNFGSFSSKPTGKGLRQV